VETEHSPLVWIEQMLNFHVPAHVGREKVTGWNHSQALFARVSQTGFDQPSSDALALMTAGNFGMSEHDRMGEAVIFRHCGRAAEIDLKAVSFLIVAN
jgi:hypothetical protein